MSAPSRSDLLATAVGLTLGAMLDHVVPDPRRGHPVAGYGRFAAALERRLYAPTRPRGVVYTALAVGAPVAAAVAVDRLTRRRPVLRAAATAVTTWAVVGGASLRREAGAMDRLLAADDLPGARNRLSHLCGRDPAGLEPPALARAVVESVAENTADAVVAPYFWGAVAGIPGLVGYRAVNTLDAMVGHRSDRYVQFGWASARFDDLLNLVPSRLTALLTIGAAPLVRRGAAGEAWRTWRRDGGAHPSPNAGQCEAATAGALGIRLGGRNTYGGAVDERPVLGDGREARPADIVPAARLSLLVGAGAAALGAATLILRALVRPSRAARTSTSRTGAS
ncbi:cobalamin biosynthesis protein [Cryptosporangium aurantiacum]|uniref:Cobalamin biosynthesis protein CobD n=1 Tax=Cryptosporangium aurantiacum TaxID=134849 RepID=A0A1M7Q9K4_9ACTN|nr:cobalamin biosynthesis protein [Cryptosporangium aurantiacum]SHN27243.1 adenosylcobinamide-phosphate synthase [Cryptosporangium aurantiacum]